MTDSPVTQKALDVDPEWLARYDRPTPRYTSYPTAPMWTDATREDAERAFMATVDDPTPISVYLHVPFCERMCFYCGCNVVATRTRKRVSEYLEAIHDEITTARRFSGEHVVQQLHIGGGTPTYLTPDELEAMMACVWGAFSRLDHAEVSLEVDPGVTTRAHLEAAARSGFNRVSLGVQDFSDRVQDIIGRYQKVEQTRRVYADARELGFESVNLDLMYGLPGQSLDNVLASATGAADLGADRVAVFGYAHVPWIKPHQKKLEDHPIPDAVERWRMLLAAHDLLVDRGYVAIGLDHFARADDELAEAMAKGRLHRNFQGYTVLDPAHLFAFGASAIGEVADTYVQNTRRVPEYIERVAKDGIATVRGHKVTAEDRLRRDIIHGIMCRLELDYAEIEAAHGISFRETFGDALATLEPLAKDGLVSLQETRLDVTPLGRFLMRNVAQAFDAYRPDGQPRYARAV